MSARPEKVLSAAWRSAGFTPDGVARLLGPVARSQLATGNRVPALRATAAAARPAPDVTTGAPDTSLVAWIRLLVVGEPVPDASFGSTGSALTDLGLAEDSGGLLHPLLTVTPLDLTDGAGNTVPGWVLSDRAVAGRDPAADHVIGPGPATRTLDALTVPVLPGMRVLDVGTGSGYLAMRAAAHGARVVATDINHRALELARLGAALSGLELDLRSGSLLEPVDGVFDRIVSNPPFVISGRSGAESLTYRDGGVEGDVLIARLLAGIGEHLAPGGVAQLLGNWEHRGGADWRDRVDGWVADDLDLWVVQRDAVDAATYVDTWLRDGGTHPAAGQEAFEAQVSSWLEGLDARAVTAIGMGHVTVRRRADGEKGHAWRRLEEATGPVRHRLGDHAATVLDTVTLLRTALGGEDAAADAGTIPAVAEPAAADADADAALRGATLVVAPDVTEVRHHRPGAADAEVIELVQGGGYGRTVRASTGLAAVVGACDGELTVGILIDAVAGLLDVDAADLSGELLPELRELLETGMLVPIP